MSRSQEETTRPDNVFTPSSSPRGRSEWIVEARRRNKLEKRINRCSAERQTDLPTPSPDTLAYTHTHRGCFFLRLYWIGAQSQGERDAQKNTWPTNDVLCLIHEVLGVGWGGVEGVGWLAGGRTGRAVPQRLGNKHLCLGASLSLSLAH